MAYTLIKLLSSGTYNAGVDWRTQFASATIFAGLSSVAGEIIYPGTGTVYGVYAGYAFVSANPFDTKVCIPDASPTEPVQVHMNGVLLSEVTTPGTVDCTVLGGMNVFEVVRSKAPLIVMPTGPLFDPTGRTGRWTSLFPSGGDPFVGGSETVSGELIGQPHSIAL